jgi:hypothetical protein
MKQNSDPSFYVPFIKLIGYGRSQTYQIVCCRCKDLFFNLDILRDLKGLFCDYCEPSEAYLAPENISSVNFLGTIIGWEIKSTYAEKKRSFYNYKKVYRRDKYQCQYCGYSFYLCNEFRPLHIDHLKPWSAGGSNRMDNMVVACSKCNHHASSKWFSSFYEKKKYINEFVQEIPEAFVKIEQVEMMIK